MRALNVGRMIGAVGGAVRPIAAAPPADQAAAGQGPVIGMCAVSKTYGDGTHALAPTDLDIQPGEFVTLLGPSGCGKSTLLRMMAGLSEPTSGRTTWWGGGYETVGGSGRELVMVFQDATLMPWARVLQNVRLPLDLRRVDRRQANGAVSEALDLVGLKGFERHYPRQLSGGMQMRVSIARALATNPNLLLMDEPFGALDEITRNRLDSDLLELWAKRHLTVVFVTHSIYEAVFLSTRVVVMSARPGRVIREIAIDAPFPRTDKFRVSREFATCASELQELLATAHGEEH